MGSQSLTQRSSIVMDMETRDSVQKHDEAIVTAGDYGHSQRDSQQALNQCDHEPQTAMHLIDTDCTGNPFENSQEEEQFADPEIDDIIDDVNGINEAQNGTEGIRCSDSKSSNHKQGMPPEMNQNTMTQKVGTQTAQRNYWE